MCDQLKKVNLATGAVTVLSAPSDEVPNGLALDNEGNLLVCQQASRNQGGTHPADQPQDPGEDRGGGQIVRRAVQQPQRRHRQKRRLHLVHGSKLWQRLHGAQRAGILA